MPNMQRIMMQFEKEGDMMEMKQELMDGTIDDVMAQVRRERNTQKEQGKTLNFFFFFRRAILSKRRSW